MKNLKRSIAAALAFLMIFTAACNKKTAGNSGDESYVSTESDKTDDEISSQVNSDDLFESDFSSADSSKSESNINNDSHTGEITSEKNDSHSGISKPESHNNNSSIASNTSSGKNDSDSGSSSDSSDDKEINEILGIGYNYKADSFYKKSTIYSTWINAWDGSTQRNWHKKNATEYNFKIKVNGKYVTKDNADPVHRKIIFDQCRDAGINAMVMDLTNGYRGWLNTCKDYQKLCYENGMKFSLAVNPIPKDGISPIEDICRFVWEEYAGLGEAQYSSAYLYKDGKPLIVLYATIANYNLARKMLGEYGRRFTFTWASGEDSKEDKWGWQLEPEDGPMLSSDSMFITDAIKWIESGRGSPDTWRKSMAFLDYGFLAAREAHPKHLIVGSFDDQSERNGWMKMDSSKVPYEKLPDFPAGFIPEICKARQMRDIYGNLTEDGFYNRTKSWIKGTVKPYNNGGILADGAYTLTNAENGKMFGADRPQSGDHRPATDVGTALKRNNYKTPLESYYWMYYLGNNEYSVIKLTSGLNLEDPGKGNLVQQYGENAPSQRWKIVKVSDGKYQIINKATGKAICDDGNSAGVIKMAAADSKDSKQLWQIKAVPNRTF